MDRSVFNIVALSVSAVILLSARGAYAFELLSEGAMDTVSAVSAGSAEELLSVAGPTAAGVTVDDDYEVLPFKVEEDLLVETTDEVSTELDFALTQEVESWADELRRQQDARLEVDVLDALPPSSFDEDFVFVPPQPSIQELTDDGNVSGDIFELQRVERTLSFAASGADTISYSFERFIERAETIDATPFPDQPSMGSGYITDLRSTSNVTLTEIKD